MRHLKFYPLLISFILLIFLSGARLYGQDTLRHTAKKDPLFAYPFMFEGIKCGYVSGQNCNGWEKYAEKYFIQNEGTVTGAEIYFEAKVKNLGRLLAFDIYSVGGDELPEDTLARKVITYRNLVANGYPLIIKFDSSIRVNNSFFIGINFLNYAHENFTDTIAIQTSDSLSRPISDLTIKGRNVVQPHHGIFTDFYERTHIRSFMAIHPIGKLKSNETIVNDTLTATYTTYNLSKNYYHPYSMHGNFSIELTGKNRDFSNLSNFKISDVHGKVIDSQLYRSEITDGKLTVNVQALKNGLYIFSLEVNQKTITGKLIVLE